MTAVPDFSYTFTPQDNAPVILYLHGFLGCREDWNPTASALGPAFGHLQIDLPGHGATGNAPDDAAFAMPGCARALIELVDHLGIQTCHVLGYSMGGRLALYLARYHAGRFGRFVIASASPGLKTSGERTERINRDHELALRLRSDGLDRFLTDWYNLPLFATLDQDSEAFRQLLVRRRRNDPEALARSLQQMGTGAQPSLWDELGSIKAAALFVAGARDAKFKNLASQMANLCPHAQLAILADAGHTVHLETPDAFCRATVRFLSHE